MDNKYKELLNEKLNKKSTKKTEYEFGSSSKQAKALRSELKANNEQIRQQKQIIKELNKQLSIEDLSMYQLRQKYLNLTRQLNRTSKNLHPEEWANLSRQVLEVRKRMSELKTESEQLNQGNVTLATTLGNLLSGAISNATARLRELAAEGIRMAESADGVQRAFNKLDSPGLLDNLRAATKGTVNDLQLMQAAVKARDFRIPLEDLGKYLAYAQLKAQETGQSVEYLTDSIIMGLGRQSKQILDNLGLSAAEISEEVAKAGDFVAGVTAIVDRQLASAGEAYVSASDKATQATVSLENAQLRLGQALLPLKERFDQARIAGTSLLAWIVEYRKLTVPAISALAAFAIAKAKLNTQTTLGIALSKTQNALQTTGIIVGKALTVMYQKMTGHKIAAARAQLALNAAMAANPWGFVLTALTTALSLLPLFKKRTDEATESLTAMDRVNRRMAESEDTSIQRIQHLTKVIHDEAVAIDLRREALAEVRKTVPGYHAELTQEGKLINDNVNAITSYVDSLKDMAKARAVEEELTEAYRKQRAAQQKKDELTRQTQYTWRLGDNIRKNQAQKELDEANALVESLEKYSTTVMSQLKPATGGDSAPKSLIKELEEQRKALVDARDAATSEKDISARNREIQLIDEKIQRLQNLGKVTKDTAAAELTASQQLSSERNRRLEQEKQLSESQTAAFKKQLDENIISQAEYDVLSARAATTSAENRLQIEQDLQKQISETTFKTAAERERAESDAAQHVLEAQTAVNRARLAEEQVFRDNLKAIQQSGIIEHESTLAQQREAELASLDIYYQAALSQAKGNAQAELQVKEAYLQAMGRIQQKYAEKEQAQAAAAQKDNDRLRQQLGLESYRTQLDTRLQMLRDALAKGALTEQEYNRQVALAYTETWKTQFDRWQGLAVSAFNALQQAEIDTSEAKYDVLISQARQAGQDTTALEEEKEARNLAIQKKYADVNFAVKVSQIIADTAVSIMRAYAELGPKAGTVAAALLSATGAAQVASANAERNKVKQLQPGGTGASSSGTRVLSSGQGGAYSTSSMLGNIIDQTSQAGAIRTIDTGNAIRAAQNSVLDSAQSATPAAFRYGQQPAVTQTAAGVATLERLDETLRSLQRDGIPASVALTEIDRKRELRDRARSIGLKR